MNEEKKLRLTVASSPHVASPIDTTNLMRDVLIALVPAMVMGVVFFVTAIASSPDWGAIATGLFVPTLPEEGSKGILTAVGLIGTTIVPYNLFLHASGASERFKDPEQVSDARFDTILSIGLGGIMGGRTGIIIAFVIAMIMNVGSYWYSDKIVLSMYQARELSEDEAPMLHRMVAELSANAGIPKPRVCVIPEDAPNAFATGRDPEHGVVAVTDGIMRILSPEELRGVIAHEIGHIANRDILIQTIAGVLASVIVSIANFMQFAAIFGGSSNDEEGGTNPIAAFLLAILAPIAASIIQMAISRSREYLADETGARICGQPLALAGALHKLGVASGQIPMQNGNPSTEQMFIVSPLFGFGGGSMANLFSTHPPLEERIARLQEMSRQAR